MRGEIKINIIKHLITCGININQQEFTSSTGFIHKLCSKDATIQANFEEILNSIFTQSNDINLHLKLPNNETSISIAAINQNYIAMEYLLRKASKETIQSNNTQLEKCYNQIAVLALFLEYGGSLNIEVLVKFFQFFFFFINYFLLQIGIYF